VTTTVLAYIPSPSQGVWHLDLFGLIEIPLRAYALFIIVGIVVALVLGDRRWEARGGQRGVIYDIALWAVPFGLVGGRLYHVMTDWRTYFGDDGAGLAGALRIWDGGLGIWGAVALGGVGAWIGCRQHGIPLPAFGDAIAPGIVLAQAIGRLGNYFNQELYGRPTTLPWGLEIFERRNADGALDSLNGASTGQLVEVVHPTFLYELLWNVLVFVVLIWVDKRFKIGHGRLFAMYVAGYCLGRFWVELMRSDVATHIAGIRVNSFTSTFVFIGAVVYVMVAPKGREDPASLAGKPEQVGGEEDKVEAFAKELTAVAATTGVVAAAKAAGEAEGEDAKAAGDGEPPAVGADEAEEPEAESEELEADQPEAEDEDESKDAEGEPESAAESAEAEEPEAEDAAEAEEPEAETEAAEPEADEPEAEDEAEAEEPEAETEAAEPEAETEAAEPEADEPEPEDEAEAEEPAAEDEAQAPEAEGETEEVEVEPEPEADEPEAEDEAEEPEAEPETAGEDESEEEEGEPEPAAESAEAEESDADAQSDDDSESDEPETEDAEAAVGADDAEPSEEEAAEEAEAVVEEADSAGEVEPTTGVLEATPEPEAKPAEVAPAEESGGRLSRWLRRGR
jgi:prolipoprotein diacylglyceryl transferase